MSSQEPPGGWGQPLAQAAWPAQAYAVKRGLGRVWGLMLLSLGIYGYYWFYVTRRQLDGEIGDGRDDSTLHTLGLIVPILNLFIVYWLWRDLDWLRLRAGLRQFPVVGYLVGSLFLAPVFYSLVVNLLNEYWDVRTQGLATDAPVTGGEKAVVAVGAALLALWVLLLILVLVIAIGISASS